MARADALTRAVFFDIGDTLVHRPTVGPGRRIAQALGLTSDAARAITRVVFRERFDTPALLAARLRVELRLGAAVEAVVTEVWHAQETEPVEVPGATACVAAARDAGARIGLVSNIWRPYEIGFRAACPAIVPLVDSWHLSYQAGVVKPDPALFIAALRALAVAPERVVMVGDSLEKDVLPAAALGLQTVWVRLDGATAAASSPPAGCTVARDLAHARALVLAAIAP